MIRDTENDDLLFFHCFVNTRVEHFSGAHVQLERHNSGGTPEWRWE